jgi:chromosome segregation ATPase
MVELVKSRVKCYKKKTKKNVGGQKKTYEYNQYQVPLKRSDNLDCSMEVFIIPKSDLKHLINEEGELKDISGQKEEYKAHIAQYETELAELEWKHNQLSKSYKDLFNKHNKARKNQKELEEKVETLENHRMKLINALKKERETYRGLKTVLQESSNEKSIHEHEKLVEQDKTKSKLEKTEMNPSDDKKVEVGNEDKKDKDIWNVLRGLRTKKEQEEKEK